jgi:hypothetical protein
MGNISPDSFWRGEPAMPDAVDPYRDWLGLEGTRRPANHYQLLGLRTGESDLRTIAAARDRVFAQLRAVDPGPQRDAWQQLAEEIRGAAHCLFDSDLRTAYDAHLSQAAAVPMARPLPPRVQVAQVRRPRSLLPQLLLTVVLVVALAIAGTYFWRVLEGQGLVARSGGAQADALPGQVQPPPVQRQPPEFRRRPQRIPDEIRETLPGRPMDERAPPAVRESAQPSWNLTPSQASDVGRALLSLSAARPDLSAARRSIAKLSTTSEPPLPDEVVVSLEMLRTYVEFYWNGVDRGIAQLDTSQEIEFGDGMAIVVERTDKGLKIRSAGKTEIIPLDPPPAWLDTVAAKRWFQEDDPANWMTLGARELVDPDGDLDRVRRLWQQAVRAGEPGDRLLPLVEVAEQLRGR